MSTENLYDTVRTAEQHVVYVAMRQAARQLQEAVNTGALEKLSLDELERLLDELGTLIAAKKSREKQYAQMTSDELRELLNAIADEISSRKAAAAPQKPPVPGPKPTVSKIAKAKASESAPPPARGDLVDLSGPIDVKWERRK